MSAQAARADEAQRPKEPAPSSAEEKGIDDELNAEYDAYQKRERRVQALALAHNPSDPPATVVERAGKYLAFIEGDQA